MDFLCASERPWKEKDSDEIQAVIQYAQVYMCGRERDKH